MVILNKLIYDSRNVCGCFTQNEMLIKLTFLIICLINNNFTNTASTSPSEVKKTVLYIIHLIIFCTSTETSITGNLRIKSLTCFKHQINIIVVLLSCGSSFKFKSVFCVHGVFKCNDLAVHFKLNLDTIFVVLYKYLDCATEKNIDGGQNASTDCNY